MEEAGDSKIGPYSLACYRVKPHFGVPNKPKEPHRCLIRKSSITMHIPVELAYLKAESFRIFQNAPEKFAWRRCNVLFSDRKCFASKLEKMMAPKVAIR